MAIKPKLCLGIESTAHTFGAAVLSFNGKVLSNERILYRTEKGGMIPGKVADHHVEHCKSIIEAALQKASGSVSIGPLLGGDAGVTGTATITSVQSPTFTTPLLHKDEQYTFYLSEYTPVDPEDIGSQQQFGPAFSGGFSIDRQQPRGDYCNGNDKFAVEATIIDTTTGEIIARKLIDECSPTTVEGTTDR